MKKTLVLVEFEFESTDIKDTVGKLESSLDLLGDQLLDPVISDGEYQVISAFIDEVE